MQSHTAAFHWMRTHRRTVAIIAAVALAFTIIAALITAGTELPSAGDVAGTDDGMQVAGLSWSRSMVYPPGGDLPPVDTLGASWS
ncbi:MAG: hypothetical protein QNJ88_07780 [Acidimicrobiia bacterium]|nr:hypothetical protein [Acidimicrobiia bacterium]